MAMQSKTWEVINNTKKTREEEELEKERLKKLKLSEQFLVPDIDVSTAPKTSSSFTAIQDSLVDKPLKSLGNKQRKITLTQLKNDEQFSEVSERFMESINSNENIYEYLRDANFSLSAAATRAAQMKRWDEQTIQDYTYLRQRFDNAEIGNFRERLGLIKDLGGDILLDPLNWLTALFALPSGGSSLGLNIGSRAVLQAALKKGTEKIIKEGSRRYTKAAAEQEVKKEAAKRFALLGATEGAAWTGLHDYFMQDIDITLGLQDDIQVDRILKSTAIGGVLGGGIGGLSGRYLAGPQYSKLLEKEFQFAAEGNVDVFIGKLGEKPFYKLGSEEPLALPAPKDKPKVKATDTPEVGPSPRQQQEEAWEAESRANAASSGSPNKDTDSNFLDWNISDKLKDKNPVTWFLRTFVSKPTEKFVDMLADNMPPIMENTLRKIRNDFDRGLTKGLDIAYKQAQLRKGYAPEINPSGKKSDLTTQSYGEYFGELIGKYHVGMEQAFGVVGLTGWRQLISADNNTKLKKLLQSDSIQVRKKREVVQEGTPQKGYNDTVYGRYTGEEEILIKTINKKNGKARWVKAEVGDLHADTNVTLDKKTYFGYARLRGLYDDVYDRGIIEGLFDEKAVKKLGYFPRIFNYNSIQKNRVSLESKIVRYNHANPDNEITTLDGFIKKVDNEWVDIPEQIAYKDDKGIDWNTFGFLRSQGKDSFEEVAAARYFFEVLDKKGKQQFYRNKKVKAWLKKNKFKQKDTWRYIANNISEDMSDDMAGINTRMKILKEDEYNYTGKVGQDGKLINQRVEDIDLWEYARRIKAKTIVDDMLSKKWSPQGVFKQTAGEGAGFLQTRVFSRIPDSELDEFVDTDVMKVSQNYFNNASQLLARSRYFGNNKIEMEREIFEPLMKELQETQIKGKKLTYDEAGQITKDFRKMIHKVAGVDDSHKNSWWNSSAVGRNLGDWLKLTQQMAHLPLATLSSITEPLILLTRDMSLNTAGSIGYALVDEGSNIISRTVRHIQMGAGKTLQGKGKKGLKGLGVEEVDGQYKLAQVSDDDWLELYKTGLALEQTVMERIEGLTGEALHNTAPKTLQNFFFKSNLLTQWTRAVQLASYTTGKRIIRQHARNLATNTNDLGMTLSKGKRLQLQEELGELGINHREAIDWWNNSLDSVTGKFDENLSKGLTNKFTLGEGERFLRNAEFYKKVNRGGNRFAKEIILNPSIQEANRPQWYSSPSAQLLVQFAGYPTVFTNTILKRFIRDGAKDVSRGELYRSSRILPTVMLMTAVAHVGNEIRSNGNARKDYVTGETKPNGEVFLDGVRRWGGFGPFDYVARFADQQERGMGAPTEIVKSIAGPIPQDIIDTIAYRRGFGELVTVNLPYFQTYDMIFGEGTKAKMRKVARGTKPKKPKKRKTRFGFEKGGLVYNVPNVPTEPDERVDKMTGEVYNKTAEFAQDVEDRALRGQMAGLGLRKPKI